MTIMHSTVMHEKIIQVVLPVIRKALSEFRDINMESSEGGSKSKHSIRYFEITKY